MKIKVVNKGTVKAKPSNYCITFLDDNGGWDSTK